MIQSNQAPVYMKKELRFKTGSELDDHPVEYVWPRRIPYGEITAFQGDSGAGKSHMALFVAAAVTRGAPWPDGSGNAPKGLVYYFTDELPEGEVKARLLASGADMDLIRVYADTSEVASDGTRLPSHFTMPRDYNTLQEFIEKESRKAGQPPQVVIFDPLLSYLDPGADPNDASTMSRSIGAIRQFAEDNRIAIIACVLQAKRGDVTAIHKVLGSVVIAARTRAQHLVCDDPRGGGQDSGAKLFLPAKLTFDRMPQGYKWHVDNSKRVTFDGPTELSAEDAVVLLSAEQRRKLTRRGASPENPTLRERCKERILAYLGSAEGGARPSQTIKELLKEVDKLDVEDRTIDNAACELDEGGQIRRLWGQYRGKRCFLYALVTPTIPTSPSTGADQETAGTAEEQKN